MSVLNFFDQPSLEFQFEAGGVPPPAELEKNMTTPYGFCLFIFLFIQGETLRVSVIPHIHFPPQYKMEKCPDFTLMELPPRALVS